MCSITETHFDCDKEHERGVRTFLLSSNYPRPNDLTFIESLIWDFAPPWYEAFADGVDLPKSITSAEHLVVDDHDYTGRCIESGCIDSDDRRIYASSNLYHRGRSYNRERAKYRSQFEFDIIPIPKSLCKPFSPDEIAWMQEPPPSKHTGEYHQTASKWPSSTKSALTMLTHCARTKADVQPIDRLVRSEIYDKNVWRIILPYAIPPSRVAQYLHVEFTSHEPSSLTDEPAKSCITADGRFFAQCWCKNETMTVALNGVHAFQFRFPDFASSDFSWSVSESYVAMLWDEITFLILSHTGAYVAHFNLTSALQHGIETFTLHPTLPLLILGTDDNVIILDFQGNNLGKLSSTNVKMCPRAAIFDSVSELVIIINGKHGFAFPLNNSPPFKFKIIFGEQVPHRLHKITFDHSVWNDLLLVQIAPFEILFG